MPLKKSESSQTKALSDRTQRRARYSTPGLRCFGDIRDVTRMQNPPNTDEFGFPFGTGSTLFEDTPPGQ